MAGFGPELRRRREQAGLSLAAFAGRTHFTKGYLSKIETGKARPNRTLADICDRDLGADGALLALVPDESDQRYDLPAVTPHFLGRAAEVAALAAALRAADGPAAQVVTGLGGLGKTTLAVAAARAAADAFPDGQFLVDLSGAPTESDCLDRALRALGVPGRRIPPDRAGRAALLRSRIGRQRVLLVLDDADNAGQLRSLLAAGGRVLVTSRHRLAALDDAAHLALGPLPDDAAARLFRAVSGAGAEDPVDELVRRCGAVPLAVRIVAARLRHGGWSCAELLDRLADQAARVASMDDGERSMAAVLATSLDGLAGPDRALLVLLAVHPGPVADLPAIVALAGRDAAGTEAGTEAALVRLHESSLITRQPGGLVVLHDLVRAHLVAAEVPTAPHRDALARLVDHVTARVAAADAVLEPERWRPPLELPAVPGFDTVAAARGWLRGQWPTAVGVTAAAGDAGMVERCWELGFLLRGFFFREKLTGPWLRSSRTALAAAEQAGAARWAGTLRNSLGMAHLERGELAEAAEQHEAAGRILAAAGDPYGATDAAASLAWVRLYQGAYEQALGGFGPALAAYRRLGRPRAECITLRGLALAAVGLGRDTDARAYVAAAEPRTPLERAMTDSCAGWVHHRAGRYADAARSYAAAAGASRAESDYELARALTGLGNTAAATGDPAGAAARWREADELGVWMDTRCVGEAATRLALSAGALVEGPAGRPPPVRRQ
jgi:transcriptional regulator with XRE-family HTH domain